MNDDKHIPLPSDTPSLVEYLDTKFPEQSPDPSMSDREIWIAVGKRMVVRHLKARLEEDDEITRESDLNVFV